MNEEPGRRDALHLLKLAKSELGARITRPMYSAANHGMVGILYDAFTFEIAYEQPRGNLAASIILSEKDRIGSTFDVPFTLDSGDEAVRGVLRQIDEWARLRLPDKYLERFDAARGISHAPATEAHAEYFTQLRYRSGQRVPVQLFKVGADGSHVYDRATQGFVADTDGTLAGLQRDPLREQLWPITAEQAAETEQMLRTDQYHPLTIPGVYD